MMKRTVTFLKFMNAHKNDQYCYLSFLISLHFCYNR